MRKEKFIKAIEFLQQGEPARAKNTLRKILKADPSNFDALRLLGIALDDLKRHLP